MSAKYVTDWNADMDAWGLTDDQRTHYLRRLHAYHRRIEDLYWRRYERAQRIEGWFAGAALLAVAALLIGAAL